MDAVYRERNQLVSALSKLYPSYFLIDPSEPDWLVVAVELPTGQVTWHIPDDEIKQFFAHLKHDTPERAWDGHNNEEKYRRLAAIEKMW